MKMTRQVITEVEVDIPTTLKEFEDWNFSSSWTIGPDFIEFAQLFRNCIKKQIPADSKIANFSVGHYYVSGFIERNGKYVYFSIPDVRHFSNDWYNNVLIRTAKHIKDYTGGTNGYTTLNDFGESVARLLEVN